MNLFITGIGTDVGKTVVSAIFCEALQADYWKPVQAGNLRHTDTMRVRSLVSNGKSVFHQEAYRLRLAASPHKAAAAEGTTINPASIRLPQTSNHLIIEGAGGLMVPLNGKTLVIDLIEKWKLPVVVVSRHYLGSINHTLLSVEALQARGIEICGIVLNGDENKATEKVILEITRLKMLGRVGQERMVNRKMVTAYAGKMKASLKRVLI